MVALEGGDPAALVRALDQLGLPLTVVRTTAELGPQGFAGYDVLLVWVTKPDVEQLVEWLGAEGCDCPLPVLLALPLEVASQLAPDLHALADDWIAQPLDVRELRFRLEIAVYRASPVQADEAR